MDSSCDDAVCQRNEVQQFMRTRCSSKGKELENQIVVWNHFTPWDDTQAMRVH